MRPLLLLTFLVFALTRGPAQAQAIPAPDLECVNSQRGMDVLQWQNQASTCGLYQATEIYRATNEAGPYTLLTEVTDAAETTFSEDNPNGEQRFYFLRYRYDCPGQEAMNSDTLDNFVPITPLLEYISIEDGEIVLNWQPSPSPEVSNYLIVEATNNNFTPIDTVGNLTTYRVTGVPMEELSLRSYRVVALDPCQNDSPQSNILRGADLTVSGGEGCTVEIDIQPDREAITAFALIRELELFVSVDGGAFTGQGPAAPEANTVIYDQGNDGEELCFYLEAELENSGERARSVTVCRTITISQPVRNFEVFGVEITNDGLYRFRWPRGDRQPTDVTTDLERISVNGEVMTATLAGSAFPNGEFIVPGPEGGLANGERLRFRVTDECGREVITNGVAPVELRATELFAGQNTLVWTPLVNGLLGETSYSVLRVDGEQLIPVVTGLGETSYIDSSTPPDGSPVCYRIRAEFRSATADVQPFTFLSNVACIQPFAEVFLPNVFSPVATQAENRIFLPQFSSPPSTEDYRLQIFSRWGALLFETTDPTEGWTGTFGNELATSGTYLYVLRYVTGDGQEIQRADRITLLR